AVLAAPAARLEAAQRRGRIDAARTIDADRARLEAARQAVRHADVAGPDRGRKTELGFVAHRRQAIGIVGRGEAVGAQHRTEDLLAAHFHARFGADQHGRLDEPARAVLAAA